VLLVVPSLLVLVLAPQVLGLVLVPIQASALR
jgi:hypothetical protein